MERRGSRTRRQPPSRQARRNGWWQARPGMAATCSRWSARMKNTRVAYGAGAVSGRGLRFRWGSEACVRHAEGAGGGPFCFACRRDDSAHLLPQKRLLGRNLITLFRCVNSFAEIFSGRSRPLSRHQDGERRGIAPMQARRLSHRRDGSFKNAAFNAVFL